VQDKNGDADKNLDYLEVVSGPNLRHVIREVGYKARAARAKDNRASESRLLIKHSVQVVHKASDLLVVSNGHLPLNMFRRNGAASFWVIVAPHPLSKSA
jgi:hypothetical protein